jgi:protoporphyrinogen oxidase
LPTTSIFPASSNFQTCARYRKRSFKWGWKDQQFIDEAFGYIKRINPQIGDDDVLDAKVGRLRHAQPICEPNFRDKLPPVQTPIKGLQIADTCYYYPEDRGVAESVRLGRRMAEDSSRQIHQMVPKQS